MQRKRYSAVAKAKERFKMPTSARVVSCYESGRDGFWLHRHLVSIGIEPGRVASCYW